MRPIVQHQQTYRLIPLEIYDSFFYFYFAKKQWKNSHPDDIFKKAIAIDAFDERQYWDCATHHALTKLPILFISSSKSQQINIIDKSYVYTTCLPILRQNITKYDA